MPKRIASGHFNGFRRRHGQLARSPQETLVALTAAMGQPPRKAKQSVIVVRRGLRRPLRHPAQVTLEDGAVLCFDKALSSDLPAGYHILRYLDEERDTRLIVTPWRSLLSAGTSWHLGAGGAGCCVAICWELGHWRFRRFARISALVGRGAWRPNLIGQSTTGAAAYRSPESEAPIFPAAAVFATRFICASRKSPEPWPREWIFNDLPQRARSSTLTRA